MEIPLSYSNIVAFVEKNSFEELMIYTRRANTKIFKKGNSAMFLFTDGSA